MIFPNAKYDSIEILLIFLIVSVIWAVLFFDVFKRKIPNILHIILLLLVVIFWMVFSAYTPNFFIKVGIIFLFVYWVTYIGIFNAAYGKLFFICSVFSVIIHSEYLFFLNFFFLIFSYLIMSSLLFYGTFFIKKKNREIFLHHRNMKTLWLVRDIIYHLGIILCIFLVSISVSISLQYAQSSFQSLLNRYLEILDIRILLLLFISFCVFFSAKLLFYFFEKYKNIHPFLFVFLIALILLLVQKNSSFPIWSEGMMMGISVMFFWIGFRFFLTGYANMCQKTLVRYTLLSPGMMIDTDFFRNRFGLDMGNEKKILTIEDIEKIQKTVTKALRKSPLLLWDILILKRFFLTPFILLALFFVVFDINLFSTALSLFVS